MSKKKGLDFKHKEVINIKNGTRLGYVQDVTADFQTGNIKEIIVPGNNKFFIPNTLIDPLIECPAKIRLASPTALAKIASVAIWAV